MANEGHKYGPVLSPMEMVPGSGHEAPSGAVTDGYPDYPKGEKDIIEQYVVDQGGVFGKVKSGE